MTIPMYNYPNFLTLLAAFVFIPTCFTYIIPMTRKGYISQSQLNVPKRKFIIMGALDATSTAMQIFGIN